MSLTVSEVLYNVTIFLDDFITVVVKACRLPTGSGLFAHSQQIGMLMNFGCIMI